MFLQPVVRLGNRGARKGICLTDVRPGVKVLSVNVVDDLGLRQRQNVVVAFQGHVEGAELFAPLRIQITYWQHENGTLILVWVQPEVFFFQREPLDHRAHGSIQNQDSLQELSFERRSIPLRTGRE